MIGSGKSVGTMLAILVLSGCWTGPGMEGVGANAGIERGADAAARGWTDADFPRVSRLADGVYAYEWLRPADLGGTTNCVFVVTSEGVLVADGQGSVEDTERMVAAIARVTSQPIRWIVVGSDHPDHRGGDSAFPAEATFFASSFSAEELEARALAARNGAGGAGVRIADRIVDDELTLRPGGREIRILNLGRAHTGGDLAVYLPDERIIYMSEIFANHVFPAMRSSYPTEAVATMERAQSMDAALYVPGHGFLDPASVLEEELETYKRAWEAVIAETKRLHALGVSAEDVASLANFGPYEDWIGRERQTERNTLRIFQEIEGKLPAPASPQR